MSPDGGGAPTGAVADAINVSCASYYTSSSMRTVIFCTVWLQHTVLARSTSSILYPLLSQLTRNLSSLVESLQQASRRTLLLSAAGISIAAQLTLSIGYIVYTILFVLYVLCGHKQESFGDFDKFKAEFETIAGGHFGSGWAWLVQKDDGKLEVCLLKFSNNTNNSITLSSV